MRTEEWRPVVGWEGSYEVSDQGRVRSRTRVLVPFNTGSRGRFVASVQLGRPRRQRRVAHLVAEAFLGPRPDGLWVLHGNDNPHDNRVTNLRYGTPKENAADAFRNGGRTRPTACIRGHVFDSTTTLYNTSTGRRACAPCRNAAARDRYRAKKAAA